MLFTPGFEPYAHVPVPEAPVSPKFHLNDTFCTTLLGTAESTVPVASKNAKNGDIPAPLTTSALSFKLPLVDEHDIPAGVVVAVLAATATATLWVADPPAPVQLNV
jgi:hypothetical protein